MVGFYVCGPEEAIVMSGTCSNTHFASRWARLLGVLSTPAPNSLY